MTRQGLAAFRTVVAVVLCLAALAGCTKPSGPVTETSPSPSSSSSGPTRLTATATASDGGHAEVSEVALTPYPGPNREYTWAVAITNTSATDLLVQVDVDVSTFSEEGPYAGPYWNLGTILPGQTAYTGSVSRAASVLTSAQATVTAAYWTPMAELAARGMDAGFTDISGSFQDSEDRVKLTVAFTSHNVGVNDERVRLLMVFRDGNGKLLGVGLGISDHAAEPPGPREEQDEFAAVEWPPGVDKSKSTVTLTAWCCEVIPIPEGKPRWLR